MLLFVVLVYCFGMQVLCAKAKDYVSSRGITENVPTSDNFLRRGLHSCRSSSDVRSNSSLQHIAVIMDNRIYIDGGQLSQPVNGAPEKGSKQNVNRRSELSFYCPI